LSKKIADCFHLHLVLCFYADFSDGIGRPRQTGYYAPRSEYELVRSCHCIIIVVLNCIQRDNTE